MYISLYIYVYTYIYIYIHIYVHNMTSYIMIRRTDVLAGGPGAGLGEGAGDELPHPCSTWATPNLPTKIIPKTS